MDGILATHVTKIEKKEKSVILNDINMRIPPGEVCILTGTGSNELLAVLMLEMQKTKGKIYIDGLDCDKDGKEIYKHISKVGKWPLLDQKLTGEENIRFYLAYTGTYPFAHIYRYASPLYKRELKKLLSLCNIRETIFHISFDMSFVETIKVEMVKQLMRKPAVLFMEDVLWRLSYEEKEEIWYTIHAIQRVYEKIIIVLALPEHEVIAPAHIIALDKGTIVSDTFIGYAS